MRAPPRLKPREVPGWVVVSAIAAAFVLAGLFSLVWMNSAKPISPTRRQPEWTDASGNVWPGITLYSREHDPVGVVKTISKEHRFPDGTTTAGVLIQFEDGLTEWLPRETVKRAYQVKTSEADELARRL